MARGVACPVLGDAGPNSPRTAGRPRGNNDGVTFRGRLAMFLCAVAAAALVVVMAAVDAEPTGDLVVTEAVRAEQPTTTSGDGGGEVETEVAGKVVQRSPAKDVPSLPDIAEMPRTGSQVLVRRLAIGLLLLGVGLLVLDRTVRVGRDRPGGSHPG